MSARAASLMLLSMSKQLLRPSRVWMSDWCRATLVQMRRQGLREEGRGGGGSAAPQQSAWGPRELSSAVYALGRYRGADRKLATTRVSPDPDWLVSGRSGGRAGAHGRRGGAYGEAGGGGGEGGGLGFERFPGLVLWRNTNLRARVQRGVSSPPRAVLAAAAAAAPLRPDRFRPRQTSVARARRGARSLLAPPAGLPGRPR